MTAIHKSRIYACSVAGIPILAFTISFLGASLGYRLLGQRLGEATPPGTNATLHTLYGGFWRTDGSFVSTLRIENVLVADSIEVKPTLYMADGTPYALPAIEIPKAGVATININQALAQAPRTIARHISQYGSTSLAYHYATGGHVNASTLTLDVPHSLTFSYPFMVVMDPNAKPTNAKDMKRMLRPSHHVLEGLWWKRDPGVTGFLVLSNATQKEEVATVSAEAEGSPEDSGRAIALRPRETRLIPLEEIGDRGADWRSNRTGQPDAGGIRIEYDGMMGDVSISGGLMNQSEGYSARMPLWERDMTSTAPAKTSYASAGVMIGQPDPMMMPGFPPQTRFAPYLVLRNTTAQAMNVDLGANYMSSGGAPVSIQLPHEALRPFEARQVDLSDELNSAGLAGFNGAINLAVVFTGKAGDLIVATGSVDQTGTYVFEVAPQGVRKTVRKVRDYWNAADGNDTMFSLWNPTDGAQDIAMTFYYGDGSGSYNLSVHLEPQASTMIDINMLKMEQTPDAKGNTFREDAAAGNVFFANAKPATWMTLAESAGAFNVQTGTCGELCGNCCEFQGNFWVTPSDATLTVGGGGITYTLHGRDCGGEELIPADDWGSSDTSVADVDASGLATANAPGSATITAGTFAYTGQGGQGECDDQDPQCPTDVDENFASASAIVKPTIMVNGNGTNSIFVGSDPVVTGDNGPNMFVATVSPDGGQLTATSSDSGDTIRIGSLAGSPTGVVITNDQSSTGGDRTLTFTYTVNGQSAQQTLRVTARKFAYATNGALSNVCSLGYGYDYSITYTPYTHPDKAAVQPNIDLNGTAVTEGFSPPTISCGNHTGNGGLNFNSQFVDRLTYCSSQPLPPCSSTNTQTIGVGGYQVRTNSLTIANTGLTYTSQGPTQ